MDAVCVTVKSETMATDDVAKKVDVVDEEERTKHRTLGNALTESAM